MAMKKQEMEDHAAQYRAYIGEARTAEHEGMYRKAIDSALAAWEHIDGMMQYARKYEKAGFRSVEAIDLVLRYAPSLFKRESLNALDDILTNQRRIERDTSESLADKLAEARTRMWDAHRLWNHLEAHSGARQDELTKAIGGNQRYWRSIIDVWEKMGLVERKSDGRSDCLSLSTRMGQVVRGKCPNCGSVTEAPKAMFLEDLACERCEEKVLFVILPRQDATEGKG